jgi:hypothetical protein
VNTYALPACEPKPGSPTHNGVARDGYRPAETEPARTVPREFGGLVPASAVAGKHERAPTFGADDDGGA